ncbi:histidine--tRNA ligase [Candidatus Woesearchaeota archaeon]|nr:histidine--tRNA ligase [Candidatus Woesearchaeota archaeon]
MFKKPKGTKDYYPEDMALLKNIEESLRKTAESYGFMQVESPAFESIELLTAKQGDEIREQIFTLEKKGEGKKREEYGLRFDLTVPMTRMFIEKQKELPKPVRWFSTGIMWRYERPQAGRQREFYQLSVELFGSDRPEADAEIIRMAIDCLRNLGLKSKEFVIKINNRVLLQDFIKSLELDNFEQVFRAIDKRLKIPEEAWNKELENASLNKEDIRKLKAFLKIKDIDKVSIDSKGKDDLKKMVTLLKDRKDYIELDFSTVRGLSYYTSTVFEIFDRKGELRSIAGGGRYDNMVELFGGESCPATGFAIGFSTLALLLEENSRLPDAEVSVDYYIAPIGDKALRKAEKIADKLRKKASVELDLMGRSISKQMGYADRINAKNVIILGDDELKQKVMKIRDMKTGKERKIKIDKI